MACSLRVFLANEVLDLICTEDSIDANERFAGLLEESDDEFKAVGDYTDLVTGETLISDDFYCRQAPVWFCVQMAIPIQQRWIHY